MTGRFAFIPRIVVFFCAFALNAPFLLSQTNVNTMRAKRAPKPAVHRIANGVQLTTGDLNVKIQFYSNDTVRVLKWTAAGTPNKNTLSVIQKDIPALKVRFDKNADSVTLSSPSLKVQIAKSDGSVHFFASDGHTLLQEGQSQLTPSNVEKGAFSLQQNFTLTPEEGVYGLGQHQYGDMNYRGKTVKLVQANRNSASPFFVSTAGYGIFWDNYSETRFSDDLKTTSFWSEVGDNIDYYFFYGPGMDQVIAGYRHLTGEAPLYGKWAYGYWQSKEHYGTRDEVMSIAKEIRTRQIPIDNIVQDWQYWGRSDNWSGMFFDEKTYPQPKEMMDQLHQQGFHLIVSIWGGLGPASPIAKEMDKRGWLFPTVGWGGFKFYDAYNPAARNLYWQYANDGLFSKGVDGWWMDSTEPDIVNALTEDAEAYEMKRVPNNYLGSFARYLNAYPLMTVEGVYQHQRQVTDRKRVYILTRSTFAGQQRAAATTWSGDIGANWDVYKRQITAGLNHSMAGIPYWTLDVGA